VLSLPPPPGLTRARAALLGCLRCGAMEDEAARPLRSSEQLEARMCELKRLVASELLSADDVAVEVAQLRAETRAWLLRTAAADVQPGGAAAPLPPPAPPALAPGVHHERAASRTAGRADNGAARGAARDNSAGRRGAAAPAVITVSCCRNLPTARSLS